MSSVEIPDRSLTDGYVTLTTGDYGLLGTEGWLSGGDDQRCGG
jgi:hypothetical protein